MNEQSFTVPSEFGGGFCYHLDEEGEEIKEKEERQQVSMPYRLSNDLDLVVESYNFEKDSNKNPFSIFH